MDIVKYNEGLVEVAELGAEGQNLYATQEQIAKLFGVEQPAISKHISNVLEDKELDEKSRYSKMEYRASDNKEHLITYYNLDMIIAVGYRVNSSKATKFRIWATDILKEYVNTGSVINKNVMLAGGGNRAKLYVDTREILTWEPNFDQDMLDRMTIVIPGYTTNSEENCYFFADGKNRWYYAAVEMTAADLRVTRCSADKPNVGLADWVSIGPRGPTVSLVMRGYNFLSEKEAARRQRIMFGFLGFVDYRIGEGMKVTREGWTDIMNTYLEAQGLPILKGHGMVSAKCADARVRRELDRYNDRRKQKLLKA